jgi:hypothetical protein
MNRSQKIGDAIYSIIIAVFIVYAIARVWAEPDNPALAIILAFQGATFLLVQRVMYRVQAIEKSWDPKKIGREILDTPVDKEDEEK